MYRYSEYSTIFTDQDLEKKVELLPDETVVVVVEITLVHYKTQLEPYQERRWNLGERRKTSLLVIDPLDNKQATPFRELKSNPQERIAFCLETTNPWVGHLDSLATHLGYDGYYTVFKGRSAYDMRLKIRSLPSHIDVVFIVARDLTSSTDVVEVKYRILERRRIFSLIAASSLPLEEEKKAVPDEKSSYSLSGDAHLHALSFLPAGDVATSSGVSRGWRDATRSKSMWNMWYRKSLEDGGSEIGLEEFKQLAPTPTSAYNASLVATYIDDVERAANEVAHTDPHMDEAPLDSKLWDLTHDVKYKFQVTLPAFMRIYDAISGFDRDAVTSLLHNFGRMGSIEDIKSFHTVVMSSVVYYPVEEPL